MAIDFPNSPANGESYTVGSKTWIYSSATNSWDAVTSSNNLRSDVGRNKVINGDFSVWQRGTSYTLSAVNTYGAADRWVYWHNGSTVGTNTVSRQAFTAGAAPVSGYEGTYFARITTTTLGTSQTVIDFWQYIEDVRTLAGQTATISFWAKSSGVFEVQGQLAQIFGSGGSGTVYLSGGTTPTYTSTSWQRFTTTLVLPSISGKTIGTNSALHAVIRFVFPTAGATFDIWGVQVEAGSVATRFEERPYAETLRQCQRYYQRYTAEGLFSRFGLLTARANNIGTGSIPLPVGLRTIPSSVEHSTLLVETYSLGTSQSVTSISLYTSTGSSTNPTIDVTTAGTSWTAGQVLTLLANNSTSAYLAFNAEII